MDDDRRLADLHIPSAERLAVNACAEATGNRILCKTVGRAQSAVSLAEQLPAASVACHFLDLFPAEDVRDLTRGISNFSTVCTPDLPEGEIDLFVLPVTRTGEAELTRDWLQQGYDRLAVGGELIATVDNFKDVWLHHEIEKLGRNLDRTPKRHGVTYRLKKLKPLKRMRDFACRFAFRDGERIVHLVSRPGVFSHRRLDVGARALMECMQIGPGQRVLDIGCGSGAVGVAAALRADGVQVHAIDSNARAVDCTLRGAELNEIPALTAALTMDGNLTHEGEDLTGTFDVVVGNPPYFSHYQIAEIFLQTARRGLKPGGRIWIVAKQTEWLIARMEQLFDDVQSQACRNYFVVSGTGR